MVAAAADVALPDAPSSQRTMAPQAAVLPSTAPAQVKTASIYQINIQPGEIAPKLTMAQQSLLGVRSAFTPLSMSGWFFAAGWSHVIDSTPNYGRDSEAFAQRLGAAAARGTSESIFSRAVFAPVLHEDARYYIMGKSSGQGFWKRTAYAGSRVFITRTNDGKATPNISLLAGNLAASALTVTYYPERDTTGGQIGKTFGGSLAGAAIGFIANEFLDDALELAHLKKRE